jgi:nitrite reductase/ring-hydroxylating ferredoxin subunit
MTAAMEASRSETSTSENGRFGDTASTETVTTTPIPASGASVRVTLNGSVVAVFNVAGRLYGLEALCGHRNGPLDQGTISGTAVVCPWHGARFYLESGAVVGGNFFIRRVTRPVRSFRVRSVRGCVAITERVVVGPKCESAPEGLLSAHAA